jgi:hypothetical protein
VLRAEAARRDSASLKGLVDTLLRAADAAADRPGGDYAGAGLQRAFDDSLVLALAWSFTGDGRYAERGAGILQRLFGGPDAELNAQHGGSHAHGLPGATTGLHYYLDAVRMFEGAGCVGEPLNAGFRTWLAALLDWLSTSPESLAERQAGDHRGTRHDLLVASIAAFLDDQDRVYDTLVRAQARIRGQFGPDGRQPGAADGPDAMHWCCYNFQGWIDLAELASRWGVDLWGYQAPDGAGLAQGARWLLSRGEAIRMGDEAGAFDIGRLQPIRFAASEAVGDLPGGVQAESAPYAARPLFPPDCGIRPFWNLASYGRPPPSARPGADG